MMPFRVYPKIDPSRPEGNMSSDADRGNYKYTKALTSGQYSTLVEQVLFKY